MKIAKKVIIALAVIILLVIVVTFISVKHEGEEDPHKAYKQWAEVDEVLAVECPDVVAEGPLGEKIPVGYTYYMLQSSTKSRETSDYYENAYTIETAFGIPDYGLSNEDYEKYKITREYYIGKELLVIGTNKYIHLFNSLYNTIKFREKQDKLRDREELLDQNLRGGYKELREYVPTVSINRETLVRSEWKEKKIGTSYSDYWEIFFYTTDCKEVDPSIPLNLLK